MSPTPSSVIPPFENPSAGGRGGVLAGLWWAVLGGFVVLALLGLIAGVILQLRQDVWGRTEQSSRNLTVALARDITRNIALYDLSLKATLEALSMPEVLRAPPPLRQLALFGGATGAEHLGSLLVLNAAGEVVAASTSPVPANLDLADRDYFQAQIAAPGVEPFVSRAFASRLRGGDPTIAISRRISAADGSFGGIVVGSLRLTFFNELFAKLDLGPDSSVTILRTDGRIVARHPNRPQDMNVDLSGSPTFARFLPTEEGIFIGTAALDGVERLYAFRHIPRTPLILVVGVATRTITAQWLGRAVVTGAILGLLVLCMLFMCFLVSREIRRRRAAERAAVLAARQLGEMANTDALTEVANRRRFNAQFGAEIDRAQREGGCLSLLSVDIDHFKSYNDLYGHLKGDECLRAVARAVQAACRGPGNLLARMGGEEFAVLLPDTPGGDAEMMAAAVIAGVRRAKLPHRGNAATGFVTVSVGIASWEGGTGLEREMIPGELLGEADRALYAAKRRGRNQAVAAWRMAPGPGGTGPVRPGPGQTELGRTGSAGAGPGRVGTAGTGSVEAPGPGAIGPGAAGAARTG
jgi:diguanylate cyclase (GGDEF)-like protein